MGCRFLIGREKDGVESEVARLINESLEMEKSSMEVGHPGQVKSFKVVNGLPILYTVFVFLNEERRSRET